LDGGGSSCLRPGRGLHRTVEVSCFNRPRHLGAPRAGDHADRSWALPVHAAQARLSPPVPIPLGFCSAVLARGTGAVNMGVRHGLYCLGCCCALFAVLTAVGMMSIAWMLSLTLVVFAEKVFPYGVRISAALGVALIAVGLLIASGALQLPCVPEF